MRVILLRHGESQNNAIREDNLDNYQSIRESDPDVTKNGIEDTILTGQKFKSLGIKIDKILTSAFKRSL